MGIWQDFKRLMMQPIGLPSFPSASISSEVEFAEPKLKPGVQEEIASIARDPNARIFRDLVEPEDGILSAQHGREYDRFRKILKDDQVIATLQQRRSAVTSKEWEVIPGDDRRISRQAADFLKAQLEKINWDALTEKAHYGIFYGFMVAEILYAREGDYVVWDAIKVRKQRRFRFDVQGKPRLVTRSNYNGEELPDKYFWYFSTGTDNDDEPGGIGLGHWLNAPEFFKNSDLKFWLIFVEKFGMPTALGKFGPNATSEDKTKLLQALRQIQSDAGVIVPHDMLVELLGIARSGTTDYNTLFSRMIEAITKVVLSQTMTTENGSSRSQSETHMGVRQEVITSDSDLINGSFNKGPVRWLMEFNAAKFPGAAMPQTWRRIEAEKDLKPLAERDEIIFGMGYEPTPEYITSTYGDGWVKRQSTPIGVLPEAGTTTEAAFAEALKPDPEALNLLTTRLQDEAGPLVDEWVGQLRTLFDEAESLEDLATKLEAAYPELSGQALTEVMGQAMLAASLTGYAESEVDNA